MLGRLMLCLKLFFRGNSDDSLCPGHDIMELTNLWHSATRLGYDDDDGVPIL